MVIYFLCHHTIITMSKSSMIKVEKKVKIKTEDKGPTLNALRENSDQSFKDVVQDLSINEFYTKADVKQKYNKFLTSVVPEPNYNYMCDLIEMPTTDQGLKWLLTMVDLATNLCDIEPMKDKSAKSTLDAFQRILKRRILRIPEISLKSDNGSEFRGVFDKFLGDNKILHKYSMPYRHQQMAPIESLNRTVARLLLNYINDKSVEIKKDYMNWTDILPQLRKELNEYRKRDLDKLRDYQDKRTVNAFDGGDPEYQIGDYVHWKIDKPTDIHGNSINDNKFRTGDRIYSVASRKIVDILYYPSEPHHRYKLYDMPYVSYNATELKPADKEGDYYIIKKIWGKAIDKDGVLWYKVWYDKEKKDKSSWVKATELVDDGAQDAIDEYEQSIVTKKKKARAKTK
jgi:hypothetical protein